MGGHQFAMNFKKKKSPKYLNHNLGSLENDIYYLHRFQVFVYICLNLKYFFSLQIIKCICANFTMYLSKLGFCGQERALECRVHLHSLNIPSLLSSRKPNAQLVN